ncbi:MAG: segregation/condensation protein A [Nitrospirae bacterium]|nr:segregation/condensation protein A [Nitrospirota bacterium]MCL5236993.1 segregation/condensation protein A [Nitrospirota bacterium]
MTESTNQYSVKIPVFEGPLDLLLHLIKQDKIDIYDIPIAQITRQYLEYIEIMKELNLEIASEFLVMAATLIFIKSRMLLPPDETIEAENQEDPRTGLVRRLLEYQAFKEASATLKEREDLWTNIFARAPMEMDEPSPEPDLYLFEVNLFDLMGVLKKILKKAPPEAIRITRETLTVKDKIAMILEKMENEHTVRFDALFTAPGSSAEDASSEVPLTRVEIIVTFLALLEILRLGLARAYQDNEFGAVWIMRHSKAADDQPQPAQP